MPPWPLSFTARSRATLRVTRVEVLMESSNNVMGRVGKVRHYFRAIADTESDAPAAGFESDLAEGN